MDFPLGKNQWPQGGTPDLGGEGVLQIWGVLQISSDREVQMGT